MTEEITNESLIQSYAFYSPFAIDDLMPPELAIAAAAFVHSPSAGGLRAIFTMASVTRLPESIYMLVSNLQ